VEVVSYGVLRKFWRQHADARRPLLTWFHVTSEQSWSNLAEVREMFPHADAIDGFTIFNIKGNRYRLITKIDYENRIVYVREMLTHADYSKGRWRR
jgi:mRNA interferase HigB